MKVDNTIEEEWILWQKEIHIPEILSTGFFYDHRFYKLLEQDEDEGKTYVVQYFALEKNDYKEYIRCHSSVLQEKAFLKWGNRVISFRTLLKAV